MTWYTASLITAIHATHDSSAVYVFEDFVLLEADSHANAESFAKKIGEERASIDDKLSLVGMPAVRLFLGVRKIRSIYNQGPDIDLDPPSHGTELSHSFFQVKNLEIAKKMATGARVEIDYVDDSDCSGASPDR